MSSVYLNRLGRGLVALLLGLAAPAVQAQKISAKVSATPPLVAAAVTTGGVIPAPPTTPQQKSLLLQMQDAFTNITQTVEPTVVNIKSERQSDSPVDDGSGGATA
ncbi:MAG: hypothetical protein M3Y28_05405, partial [Armatimonadota bacterium]|nr:hypothetical protein [Armatimonadota bacterium]